MMTLKILNLAKSLEQQHYKLNLCFARNEIIHTLGIKDSM